MLFMDIKEESPELEKYRKMAADAFWQMRAEKGSQLKEDLLKLISEQKLKNDHIVAIDHLVAGDRTMLNQYYRNAYDDASLIRMLQGRNMEITDFIAITKMKNTHNSWLENLRKEFDQADKKYFEDKCKEFGINLKTPKMEPFVKRLIKEQQKLEKKVIKLNNFLASEEAEKIDEKQLSLMGNQAMAMAIYNNMLVQRIELLYTEKERES